MSLQLAGLLGIGVVVAGLGLAVWIQTLRAGVAESRAVVAEQSMQAAMAGAAAERRAREALQAERDRLSAAVGTRDRLVRAARAELEAAHRVQLEGRDDDQCRPLDAPLCPAAVRVLLGDADGRGARPGGGEGAAAAGAARPLP